MVTVIRILSWRPYVSQNITNNSGKERIVIKASSVLSFKKFGRAIKGMHLVK